MKSQKRLDKGLAVLYTGNSKGVLLIASVVWLNYLCLGRRCSADFFIPQNDYDLCKTVTMGVMLKPNITQCRHPIAT